MADRTITLTVQERSDEIAEWVRLTEQSNAAQLETHCKPGQKPGGINAAVRALGIARNEAQRAVKIARAAPTEPAPHAFPQEEEATIASLAAMLLA